MKGKLSGSGSNVMYWEHMSGGRDPRQVQQACPHVLKLREARTAFVFVHSSRSRDYGCLAAYNLQLAQGPCS